MSLDVYLYDMTIPERVEKCQHCNGDGTINLGREPLFQNNITHNLTSMADEAGVYRACWRPEELGITQAGQLIPILEKGVAALEASPAKYRAMNPSNGWGSYDGFLGWLRKYLEACRAFPEATIYVSR